MPEAEEQLVTVNVTMGLPLLKLLQESAAEDGMSVPELVEFMCEQWAEQREEIREFERTMAKPRDQRSADDA